MNQFVKIFIFFCCTCTVNGQSGFQFENRKSSTSLSFQLVNNLIIIPLTVNGVKLNFLLDTGVTETLIFSLDDAKEVAFTRSQSVMMKGFGSKNEFIAYKCKDNQISLKNYVDRSHTIYLVLDQEINISSQVGITVNGIIGHHFFQNNYVKINYGSKIITVYKPSAAQLKKIEKKYVKVPISIENYKPYINALANFENDISYMPSKLLIDTGNSDGLWFFKETNSTIKIPSKNIDDFLGRGLNGSVFGKRGRISSLQIANFTLQKPIASFPDSLHTNNISFVENRVGSLGSEIVKRFDLIFNYTNECVYLKKNNLFFNPFEFNKSGIEVQHQGLQWAMDTFEVRSSYNATAVDKNGEPMRNDLRFKFNLKPVFVITNVRKDSPAAIAGLLKDDVLITINGANAGDFKLQEIFELLKGDENKTIYLQIERNNKMFYFKFQLKSIL